MHSRSHQWHQLGLIVVWWNHLQTVRNARCYHNADCDYDHSLIASNVVLQPRKMFNHVKQKDLPKMNTARSIDTDRKNSSSPSSMILLQLMLAYMHKLVGAILITPSTSRPSRYFWIRKSKMLNCTKPTSKLWNLQHKPKDKLSSIGRKTHPSNIWTYWESLEVIVKR